MRDSVPVNFFSRCIEEKKLSIRTSQEINRKNIDKN
jgi:hypothetical protein